METKEWSNYAVMSVARRKMGLAVLDGHLYAIGGITGPSKRLEYLRTVERFNPLDNAWSAVTNMAQNRADPGVGILNGRIYVIGGQNEAGFLSSVECYDPKTFKWKMVGEKGIQF